MDTPVPNTSNPEDETLPQRQVTMNQVVAYNLAYFRKVRGLTQEDLGEKLEKITQKKWSKATISAAERSWDGNRIRSFDADDLLAFCQALEFPLGAFFLPPTEDGIECEYLFRNAAVPNSDAPWGDAYSLVTNLFASRDEHGYIDDAAYLSRLEAVFAAYGEPDDMVVSRPRGRREDDDEWGGVEHLADIWNQISVLRKLLNTLEKSADKLRGTDREPASRKEVERIFREQFQADLKQERESQEDQK